jgi:hypothetical protein
MEITHAITCAQRPTAPGGSDFESENRTRTRQRSEARPFLRGFLRADVRRAIATMNVWPAALLGRRQCSAGDSRHQLLLFLFYTMLRVLDTTAESQNLTKVIFLPDRVVNWSTQQPLNTSTRTEQIGVYSASTKTALRSVAGVERQADIDRLTTLVAPWTPYLIELVAEWKTDRHRR